MKPRLLPIYFLNKRDNEFEQQLDTLQHILEGEVEFLTPQVLGETYNEAEAFLFPQLLGDAYRQYELIKQLKLPILILTSEFGTQSMWDWEICEFLRRKGVDTIAPYNLEQTKYICRALVILRIFPKMKLLVFQDNPGDGFQASIFKRFYWWEDECVQIIKSKFGIHIEKKSYKVLAQQAKTIPDSEINIVRSNYPGLDEFVSENVLRSAIRLYLALQHEIDENPNTYAVGINCLNESFFSDSTPCLAWNWLFEKQRILWGCEADLVSMMTEILLYHSLQAPLMMTNLYPFLLGETALKHEKIPQFPERENAENYFLAAHCGYLGVIPKTFSSEWALRPKVLEIVDENASAIDARLTEGPITLVKLAPTMDTLVVIEGILDGYIQYPNSHCRNGAIIRVQDGHRVLRNLVSHHMILVEGNILNDLSLIAKAFNLAVEIL
jgi:hypothetical protein